MEKKFGFSFSLYFSYLVDILGDSIFTFALSWYVVSANQSTMQLGIVMGVSGITLILGNIFGGILTDLFNKKKVMIVTDLISGIVCFCVVPFLNPYSPQTYLLIILNSVLNLCLCISSIAEKSIIKEIVPEEKIKKFNSILNTTVNFLKLVSPLLGGILISLSYITFQSFVIINGISFLISSFILIFLNYKKEVHIKENILNPFIYLKSTILYLTNNKNILNIILFYGIINMLLTGFDLSRPLLITNTYNLESKYYSYLLFAESLAGVLCGIITALGHANNPYTKSLYKIIFFLSISIILSGLIEEYMILLLVSFITGYCITYFNINYFTILQNKLDSDNIGRVFSIMFISISIFSVIGNIIFGFLISFISNSSLLIIGVGLLLSTIIFYKFNNNLDT